MKDIAKMLCEECKGMCCKHYPMFVEVNGEIKKNEPVYLEGVLGVKCKWEGTGCYYHSIGGCSEDVKPEECSEWYCDMIDKIIFEGEIVTWNNYSPRLRAIHRLLNK